MKVLESFVMLSKELPPLKRGEREVAFIGRSNVGKSSLLNHLIGEKTVAKVSNKPGKTKGIHFYRTKEVTFVDLPGYGYANVTRALKTKWADALTHFLENRAPLMLILLDIRRTPSTEDIEMIKWAQHHDKEIWIVFTKADKLKKNELTKQLTLNLNTLKTECDLNPDHHILYTIKEAQCRKELLNKVIHVST